MQKLTVANCVRGDFLDCLVLCYSRYSYSWFKLCCACRQTSILWTRRWMLLRSTLRSAPRKNLPRTSAQLCSRRMEKCGFRLLLLGDAINYRKSARHVNGGECEFQEFSFSRCESVYNSREECVLRLCSLSRRMLGTGESFVCFCISNDADNLLGISNYTRR